MKIGEYSLYKFKHKGNFDSRYSSNYPIIFSPSEYSRFKYGSKSIARKYGTELAENFFDHFKGTDKQIVVISSPFDFIPTATFAMKDYFLAKFNELLLEDDFKPAQELKVHRTRSYNHDYGLMSAEERHALISGDKFHIDKEFVKGKFVIFLDDVKITGGHERVMQKLIDENQLECDYMFLYFAELVDPSTNPAIEAFLNNYYVKNLLDVNNIIRDDEFLFNTRVVKYILCAPELEFCNFISYQSEVFRRTLYDNAIGNSYHLKDEYKVNFNHLRNDTYEEFVKNYCK